MSETTSLLDLLTILLAFSTIMLVLSLIVTSLVQGTQAMVGLRARNLRRGLKELLAVLAEKAGSGAPMAEGGSSDSTRDGTLWGLATRLVSDPRVARPRRWLPTGGRGLGARLAGPFRPLQWTTWLEKEELLELVTDHTGLDRSRVQGELDRWFERFEANLSKGFLAYVRWITFAFSLAVAGLFQLDAVETLRWLSANAEARERIAAAAEPLLAQAEEDLRELGDLRTAAGEALARLEERFAGEDVEARIEEVSGVGPTRADVVQELRVALAGNPKADEVVEAYDDLLSSILEEHRRQAEALRKTALSAAADLDIAPWPDGPRFYWDRTGLRLGHAFGVLLTALFLSLGAPFWFKQLRRLVELRDTIQAVLDPKEHDRPRRR